MAADHKFKTGQTVLSVKLAYSTIPEGRYEVTRLLPADGRGNQYRIRSIRDGHERVVRESELTPQ